MKLSDDAKAICYLFGWLAVFGAGMLSESVIGYIIAGLGTALAVVIGYNDIQTAKVEKRLEKYKAHQREELRLACEKE